MSPPQTHTRAQTFQLVRTWCGHEFYMDPATWNARHADGDDFWCPVCGEKNHWSDNEVSRLRRRAELAEERSAHHRERANRWRAEAENEQRRRVGYQGALAKTQRRLHECEGGES